MANGEPERTPAQEAHRRFQITWLAFQCILPISAMALTWAIDEKYDNAINIPALIEKLKLCKEALIYDTSRLQALYRTFADGSLMLYSALMFVSIYVELNISRGYEEAMIIRYNLSIIALLFAFIAFMAFALLKVDTVLARSNAEQNMGLWLIVSIVAVLTSFALSWAAFWHFSPYSGQALARSHS